MNKWRMIALGEILKRVKNEIKVEDELTYKQVTVRLWNKGVILRGMKKGGEIKTKRQFLVRTGQLVLSRIDVRNGAIGICPPELEGAIVSNDFWVYNFVGTIIFPKFFALYVNTSRFLDEANRISSGTTKRIRAEENAFLRIEIPLPPLDEQRRIVARIEALAARVNEAQKLIQEADADIKRMRLSAFYRISTGERFLPMSEVAPLVRRPVLVNISSDYPELGIRSFGKGTFHKPNLSGADVGTKRLYEMKPGDLVFNNVFAWEGAVAVVKPEDKGRVGSHRFITCVPKNGLVTSAYLCSYFLTDEGLEKLGDASPGGAGRNRTLGLRKLGNVEVPVPDFRKQLWFDQLTTKTDELHQLNADMQKELNCLLPSILDRAFKSEL